ncbi:MAG: MBL fold metallo-hydrolase [Acidobacteriota bacterium]
MHRPALDRLSFLRGWLNLYLLDTPAGPVLVDAGTPGMSGWIERRLVERGLRVSDLAGVVLTHFHVDHAGCAAWLSRRGVPVLALADEVPILAGTAPHPGYGRVGGRLLLALERAVVPPVPLPGVRALQAGDRLFDGDWTVVSAPGHTPGSLALFQETTGDLLSGDTLVSDFDWPRGPHPLFSSDVDGGRASARRLLELEPRVVWPAHGRPLPPDAWGRLLR